MKVDKSKNRHYGVGGIETIQFIKAKLTGDEFRGFCKGNVLKYLSRHKGSEAADAVKAADYLRWYRASLEGENPGENEESERLKKFSADLDEIFSGENREVTRGLVSRKDCPSLEELAEIPMRIEDWPSKEQLRKDLKDPWFGNCFKKDEDRIYPAKYFQVFFWWRRRVARLGPVRAAQPDPVDETKS